MKKTSKAADAGKKVSRLINATGLANDMQRLADYTARDAKFFAELAAKNNNKSAAMGTYQQPTKTVSITYYYAEPNRRAILVAEMSQPTVMSNSTRKTLKPDMQYTAYSVPIGVEIPLPADLSPDELHEILAGFYLILQSSQLINVIAQMKKSLGNDMQRFTPLTTGVAFGDCTVSRYMPVTSGFKIGCKLTHKQTGFAVAIHDSQSYQENKKNALEKISIELHNAAQFSSSGILARCQILARCHGCGLMLMCEEEEADNNYGPPTTYFKCDDCIRKEGRHRR